MSPLKCFIEKDSSFSAVCQVSNSVQFKGTMTRDFDFRFFHESVSPEPLATIVAILIFSKISEDIRYGDRSLQ